MKSLNITGIKTTPATVDELHHEISRLLNQNTSQSVVLSANIHGLNLARKHQWLREFYSRADIVRVDGAGVVAAAHLLGHPIPGRATWGDWGWQLAAHCASNKHTLYFLGGKPGSALETARKMRLQQPDIKIVGIQHGYFKRNTLENQDVINAINRAQPDILIVGLGMPVQERWILDHQSSIKTKMIITAGAAFEYLSGNASRCPRWMGKAGFEWLYRLIMEPRRMAKRYLIGNTVFLFAVLRQRFFRQHQLHNPHWFESQPG